MKLPKSFRLIILKILLIVYSVSPIASYCSVSEYYFHVLQQKDTTVKKIIDSSKYYSQKPKQKDTIPKKIIDSSKSKADTAAKKIISKVNKEITKDAKAIEEESKKLISRILSFFKFRANNNKRILSLINNRLKDSLLSSYQISTIVSNLTDTTKQNVDSLVSIITKLKAETDYIVLDIKKDSIAKVLDSLKKTERKIPIGSSIKPLTDLEKFAVQLQDNAEKESKKALQKDKDTLLSTYHKILAEKGTTYNFSKVIEGTKTRFITSYKLSVSPSSRVVFFRNIKNNDFIPEQKNLDFISNIIITDAVVLDQTGYLSMVKSSYWKQNLLLKNSFLNDNGKLILNVQVYQPSHESWLFKKSSTLLDTITNNVSSLINNNSYANFAGVSLDLSTINLIDINLDNLSICKRNITRLINNIADSLPKGKIFFLCLPPSPNKKFIDLDQLNKKILFIINFKDPEKGISAPSDPLTNFTEIDRSLTLSFTTYANTYKVRHSDYILALSYKGTQWELTKGSDPDTLLDILKYSDVLFKFGKPNTPFYGKCKTFFPNQELKTQSILTQEVYSNKYINLTNSLNRVVSQIWFNDASTLSKKYDFINDNKLGGIAIDELGDDSTRPELWDVLLYKFGKIDTLDKKVDSLVTDSLPPATLMEKIIFRLRLYNYILQNPCALCFENVTDTALKAELLVMLKKLGVEQKIIQSKLKLNSISTGFTSENLKRVYANSFQYIQEELTLIFLVLTILLSALSLILVVLNSWKIKTLGEEWIYANRIWVIFAISFFFALITGMGYVFVDKDIEIFGSTSKLQKIRNELKKEEQLEKRQPNKKNNDSLPVYRAIIDSLKLQLTNEEVTEFGLSTDKDSLHNSSFQTKLNELIYNSCTPIDPSEDTCINMPFYTLILILLGGIVFGYFSTQFLVIPFIKRETPFARKRKRTP